MYNQFPKVLKIFSLEFIFDLTIRFGIRILISF